MKRLVHFLAIVALSVAGSVAQQTATPQTARQALLEMFFSKTPGTLVKHLPAATLSALAKSGALANLQAYSMMANQLHAQGNNLETFETGSVLLSASDPKTGQKVEITVENDALRGDQDDIEVAFQIYKNGTVQRTPFMPQMTFTMKQEAQVWTLNEISVTIHLPLANPDFLKAITDKMAPHAGTNGGFTTTPQTQIASQAGSDPMVLAAMRTILSAETTYAATYAATGFTCTLSNLDGFGSSERNEHQAMLINSGLASGRRYGFVFSLSECGGSPATTFRLTAAPNANSMGRKAFCADQSGVIRSSNDGKPETCLARGEPVQ